VFGHLGVPEMGAVGAAIATTVVRWLMFLGLAGYVLVRLDVVRLGVRGSLGDGRGLDRRLRRIGLPMGIAHGAESTGFSAMILFAGWVGANDVAAYTAAMNLIALAFMCAVGLATAASVRVGNAVGRGDAEGVAAAGWIAMAISVVLMLLVAVCFRAFAWPLAGLFGSDPEMLALAVATVAVASFVVVPDALQGVCIGALRGVGDVWPATCLYLVSFLVVMVPAGYLLGVRLGHGAPGLMQAVLVGTVVAAVLLCSRFRVVSRRAVSRA
jgi:MATE family multidrug resistance protein